MHVEVDDLSAREQVELLLAELRQIAEDRNDLPLLWTVDALQRVHGLYPDADTLAARGTPEHIVRVRVHNEITDATTAHYERIVLTRLSSESVGDH